MILWLQSCCVSCNSICWLLAALAALAALSAALSAAPAALAALSAAPAALGRCLLCRLPAAGR